MDARPDTASTDPATADPATADGDAPRWFTEALAAVPTDRTVRVKGTDVHYLEWGEVGRKLLVQAKQLFRSRDRLHSSHEDVVVPGRDVLAESFDGCGREGTILVPQ